jgi:hypothetical protein
VKNKIEPFVVNCTYLTPEQEIELVDKCIEAGATLYQGIYNHHKAPVTHKCGDYYFIGVDAWGFTGATNIHGLMGVTNIIKYEDVNEHLGLSQEYEDVEISCKGLTEPFLDYLAEYEEKQVREEILDEIFDAEVESVNLTIEELFDMLPDNVEVCISKAGGITVLDEFNGEFKVQSDKHLVELIGALEIMSKYNKGGSVK